MDRFISTFLAQESSESAAPAGAPPAAGQEITSTGTPDAPPEGTPQPNAWSNGMEVFIIFFFLLIAMWFLMIRPQQKEQKRRQGMWDSLRKTDKIVTIGGIHGVVTDIDRQKETVTLRVDETNNVKITIWTNSIAQILSDNEKE